MCGRFALVAPPKLVNEYFAINTSSEYPISYNIAPSNETPIIYNNGNTRQLRLMQWGYIPRWSREEQPSLIPINARSEYLTRSRIFSYSALHQRCLIPASGYFEWKRFHKMKQPYFISSALHPLLAFAGIWSQRGDHFTFAILTCASNPDVGHIHNRMPLLIPAENFDVWLRDKPLPNLKNIIHYNHKIPFDVRAVSIKVNSAAFNQPECLVEKI